ncbi:MAG: phospho-sugar mutase, partial [Planctomycetota bacterium]|nr:phospho-sugar mutase [Planctomycetota bacterium]
SNQWRELDDAFWKVLEFGTGGRRGRMYPFGSNTINERTIGESAQGLANYVRTQCGTEGLKCAVAYDTRHRSRKFAELCSGIMVANGFQVYLLDDYRATPQLSFLVRQKQCHCGIMVTASHNPPSDNAVKVYWSTGGQILPPHDQAIIREVMDNVKEIESTEFQTALLDGHVSVCTAEIDRAYEKVLVDLSQPGPRDLRLVYSPLHGVGGSVIPAVLKASGFEDVVIFPDHANPDPDFTNVAGHVSNPENVEVYEPIIEFARQQSADVVLVTDPDADRLGCAAPVSLDAKDADWKIFNGNQLCAILGAYRLESLQDAGQLTNESFQVTTLVTTQMLQRIGESFGVSTRGDLLVGFKWIAGAIDEGGADHFVFGTEESHGFMISDYCRDKDGAVACMLLSELAARLKAEGKTLMDYLESLYWQHGYHQEDLTTIYMEGSEGMARMTRLMEHFRVSMPEALGGCRVQSKRDYLTHTRTRSDGTTSPLSGPTGNLIFFDLDEEGNYVGVRPSGTEPKVKIYLFTYESAENLADLEVTREKLSARIKSIQSDIRKIVEQIS